MAALRFGLSILMCVSVNGTKGCASIDPQAHPVNATVMVGH